MKRRSISHPLTKISRSPSLCQFRFLSTTFDKDPWVFFLSLPFLRLLSPRKYNAAALRCFGLSDRYYLHYLHRHKRGNKRQEGIAYSAERVHLAMRDEVRDTTYHTWDIGQMLLRREKQTNEEGTVQGTTVH